MKKQLLYMGIACSSLLAAVSCSQEELLTTPEGVIGNTEITINPYIGNPNAQTRLDNPLDDNNNPDDKGYDARISFVKGEGTNKGDLFELTRVQRTTGPVSGFIYLNKKYYCNSSGGWMQDGWDKKIFWTDGTDHTFIGYSVPRSDFEFAPKTGKANDEKNNVPYYGTLSTDQTTIDNYRGEDLLLTYDNAIKADQNGGSVSAKLMMHHAFAKVKIVLNIKGFAWTNDASEDLTTEITSIGLTKQPVEYVWDQSSYNVAVKEGAESTSTINAWNALTTTPTSAQEKQFIAYALVLPGTRDLDVKIDLTYSDVAAGKGADGKYPVKKPTYYASLKNVIFTGGERTTLSVTLSHENEGMIVKATYNDWVDVDLNDHTNLQKKSIFLSQKTLNKPNEPGYQLSTTEGNTDREKCNWLYKDTSDEDKIKDCYGNDGSKEHPYLIKYADELVAFKQEIEKAHNTFEGKYVKLFTDIYLQEDNTAYSLDWQSIGNDTYSFAGTFDGNYSAIQSLIGAPLFKSLPSTATIKHLTVQTYDARKKAPVDKADVYATGGAILCETNNGTIMGCAVNGTATDEKATGKAAGIALTNNGTISACYHQGAVKSATGAAAGLVYSNAGTITGCYQAGEITGTDKSGIVAEQQTGGKATFCYYDTFLAPSMKAVGTQDDTDNVKGVDIAVLKNNFATTLNNGITTDSSIDVHYIQNPGEYPTLEPEKKAGSEG